MQELLAGIRAGGKAYALRRLVKQVYEQDLGRVQEQFLFQLFIQPHSSSPLSLCRTLSFFTACSSGLIARSF